MFPRLPNVVHPDRFAAGQPGSLVFVADSGSGVAPEDREKIFEPFYTTKEPGRGTGLGLAIVARSVHEMGGVVLVDVAREGGGRIQDLLPDCAAPVKKVLVIDDEPGLRQSLGLLLTDAGYAVTAESDGRRGLERAVTDSFDIVLCGRPHAGKWTG